MSELQLPLELNIGLHGYMDLAEVLDCGGNPITPFLDRSVAKSIVKACNYHDELLEACKYALPLLVEMRKADGRRFNEGHARTFFDTMMNKMKEAIAKAEESDAAN